MLVQKIYHHPYIPSNKLAVAQPPYVGGELAHLTSMTPFLRGQGIPIYPPQPQVIRAVRYCPEYAGLKDLLNKRPPLYNNSDVGLLQAKIGTSVDNDWGNDTTAALKSYQKAQGLQQTGIVDTPTLNALQGKGGKAASGGKDEKPKWWEMIGAGLGAGLGAFGQGAQAMDSGITTNVTNVGAQPQGMSTGLKVGLAVGGVAIVGLLVAVVAKG